jgi:hypothetical protein
MAPSATPSLSPSLANSKLALGAEKISQLTNLTRVLSNSSKWAPISVCSKITSADSRSVVLEPQSCLIVAETSPRGSRTTDLESAPVIFEQTLMGAHFELFDRTRVKLVNWEIFSAPSASFELASEGDGLGVAEGAIIVPHNSRAPQLVGPTHRRLRFGHFISWRCFNTWQWRS